MILQGCVKDLNIRLINSHGSQVPHVVLFQISFVVSAFCVFSFKRGPRPDLSLDPGSSSPPSSQHHPESLLRDQQRDAEGCLC